MHAVFRNRTYFIGLSVVALTLTTSATATAQTVQKLSPRAVALVDDAVANQVEKQNVVGVAIGVIQNGEIAYLKSYGFENRAQKVPVTEKTMFRWASISKTLTAYAALQLVEKGKLDLNADVQKYVPEFPDKQATITSRELLCHQSGIVHYSNGRVIRTKKDYDVPNPFESVIAALDTFKDSPLVSQPGEKFSYSTHAYILLSAVVERAGQQKFADQVADRIAQPLRLKTLQPDYQWKEIPNRAVGYKKVAGFIVRSTDTDVSWKLGGGGFISDIQDLATYATAILNGKLISEATQSRMWTPQKTKSGQPTRVGLGVFVEGKGRQLKVSHSGSQEKARCRMILYPNQRSGVVVMSNSENANPGDFATAIYRALSMAK